MPSRSSGREPPRPTRLAVPSDEAAAKIRNRLEIGEALLKETILQDVQELEVFRGEVRRWSTITYELLRRLFDSDQYADQFLMARQIYINSGQPSLEFSRTHESLRSQYRELETILALIHVIEEIPIPVRATPATAAPRPTSGPVVQITNSTVGTFNLGDIKGSIQNNINALPPSASDFKGAIGRVMEATLTDQALNDDQRRDILEHLDTLTDYAKREPAERKSAITKSLLSGLAQLLQLASTAYSVWEQWQPTISGFLK